MLYYIVVNVVLLLVVYDFFLKGFLTSYPPKSKPKLLSAACIVYPIANHIDKETIHLKANPNM